MCKKIIQNWLTLAEYDLQTAQAMLAADRYLYVAFTCQQELFSWLRTRIV